MAQTSTMRRRATKEPTAGETLQAIRDWADRHGHLPTQEEWARADGHPSVHPILRRFGSWKGGLAAAGYRLEPGHRPGPRG